MKTTVSSIDFGTSKIVALVAENGSASRCDVVGAGIVTYDGFTAEGEGWNNPNDLDTRIREAIAQAEKQSHHKIRDINVGVPGACTKVYVTEATVSLSGPDPKVTPGDVNAIFAAAETNLGVLPGTLIHSSPAWFRVDGGKKTLEPVGIKGRELKAMISFVVAKASFVDDVIRRLTNMGITPKQFFSTPAGEAMLYLDEKDRDFTAVLIDVGYQTTEVMAVEGDALIFHRCIDIGGGDITAELARELNVHFPTAEKNIKQPFVYSMSATPETYEVPAQGDMPARTFTRDEVSPIVTRVVDELAQEIKNALDESGVKLSSWSNVYLTGGGIALNRGGKDYLSSKLGRPVRETPRRSNKMSTPLFSSSMGLMNLIVDTIEQQRSADSSFIGGVRKFFRSLVGG
ncbi:MAG: hypothetical protein IKK57_04715 [Clostridia bacterium]|nr:hypothetical protein [Clostridia bacterium]